MKTAEEYREIYTEMGCKGADILELVTMVKIDALTWAKDVAINAGKLSVATDIMEKIDELKGDKGE